MAVDAKGNIYVTGWATKSTTKKDILVAGLPTDGNTHTSKIFNGSNENDQGWALVLDSNRIYLTGFTYEVWQKSSLLSGHFGGFVMSLDKKTFSVKHTEFFGAPVFSLFFDSSFMYIAGTSGLNGLNHLGLPDRPHSGGNDGYVAKFKKGP